jgi:hypothetical protein
MARIAGVDLPREKRIEVGLTYVYGIGQSTADEILARQINTSNTSHKAPPLVTSHVLVGACAGNLRTWPPSVLGTVSAECSADL